MTYTQFRWLGMTGIVVIVIGTMIYVVSVIVDDAQDVAERSFLLSLAACTQRLGVHPDLRHDERGVLDESSLHTFVTTTLASCGADTHQLNSDGIPIDRHAVELRVRLVRNRTTLTVYLSFPGRDGTFDTKDDLVATAVGKIESSL